MRWDVTLLSGIRYQVAAAVVPETLNGFWVDCLGNTGDLVFVGTGSQSPGKSDGPIYISLD